MIENRIILFWTNMETQKVRIRRFAIRWNVAKSTTQSARLLPGLQLYMNMEIYICFGNITLLSLNSTSLVPNIEHISGTAKMAVTNKVRKAKLIKRKMIGLLQRYILSDLIKTWANKNVDK